MKRLIVLFAGAICMLCGPVSAQNINADREFYDSGTIRDIRLYFEKEDWKNILDSLRMQGNMLLEGKVKIDDKEYEKVGVRNKESRSFQIGGNRNSLYIKLDYADNTQNHQGYKSLNLSNAIRDPSLVREVLSYEIAGKYMPAPKANYARLYINDDFRGLFVNIETVDEPFLEKHFGSSGNTFIQAAPDLEVKQVPAGCKKNLYTSLAYDNSAKCYKNHYRLKSAEGWDDLQELTRILSEEVENIENILNVDHTLWMLAFNNVLVNLSSYTGQYSPNFYLYRNDLEQFSPVIWDLNLSFGSYKNTGHGSDLELKELQMLDPYLHANDETKPLISQLLKNPEYRKIYTSHVQTILADNFENDWYEKRAKELQSMILIDFYNDQNKFYDVGQFNKSLTNTIGERSKIPGIVELMSKRVKYLRRHPEIAVAPPKITNLSLASRPQFSSEQVTTFKISAKVEVFPKKVRLFYRYEDGEPYRELLMADDGKNNDGVEGDNVFGAIVDPKGKYDSITYYLVAENAKTITFDPPHYMFEPHVANLKELNQ